MLYLRAALIFVFIADLVTTGVAFSIGAVEANPVMADWSLLEITAAKLLVLVAVLYFVRQPTRTGKAVLTYGILATGGVAAWNAWQIMQYGGVV